MRAWTVGIGVVAGCAAAEPTDSETTPIETSILSVGSAFGECMSACQHTVTFAPALGLSIGAPEEPVVQAGTLTAAGLAELARVDEGLATAALDPVYGCPDCADGGAMILAYEREGTEAETQWEYGSPPDALLDVDALFHHLDDALASCTATEWVEPADDCVPFASR